VLVCELCGMLYMFRRLTATKHRHRTVVEVAATVRGPVAAAGVSARHGLAAAAPRRGGRNLARRAARNLPRSPAKNLSSATSTPATLRRRRCQLMEPSTE